MAQPATSAITMAFNSASNSIDIAGQPADKASPACFAGAKRAPGLPPTPPNSISPNLPAHVLRAGLSSPPPIQIDQDLDLQDAVDHAAAQDQPQLEPVPLSKGALSGLENTQAITPVMLAKIHLPNIILGHGPIAIRHVMACLTQAVPGFSRIPPTKARRLVVAALESRSGGGQDGNIEFEKVGWGRWDAHVKGQASAGTDSSYLDGKMSSPVSEPSSYAVSHAGSAFPIQQNRQRQTATHGHSHTGSSMPSFDEGLEDMSMSENEADDMSLDGSDTDDSMSDSAGDETEPEDWAAIGADALRRASIPTHSSSMRRNYNLLSIPGTVYNRRFSKSSTRRESALTKSVPLRRGSSSQHLAMPPVQRQLSTSSGHAFFNNNIDSNSMDIHQTPQERDAIAALLSMGSM